MLATFALLLRLALVPPLVLAQSAHLPTESVTVTGTKSREVLHGFVKSLGTPTRLTGKLARWADGICPVVVGLRPGFTKFVSQRVKEVAARAGAPVSGKASCKPNIEIVFTTTPQALLDGIRKEHTPYLGYADNNDQRDRLATVTSPIQAWYMTATRDLHGKLDIDSGKSAGPGLEIWLPCPQPPGVCLMHLPEARAEAVSGTRLGDGLRSSFYHVVIVANPTRLVEYEIGSLADYIAMLALTQLNSLDACQQLPSIVNMLAKDCANRADTLTPNDTAYLRGLYKMSADLNLGVQQDEVSYQMERELNGK